MTIADKLELVRDCKLDIKDAIEAKGVTVGDASFDQYASKIEAIPTPIEEAPENDVNFYDYDGFRVASYTIAEAKALTALPTPPSHEGLTFQEWNWTLADIQGYDRQYIDIGANYITTDEATHVFADVVAGDVCILRLVLSNLTLKIDWGDGTIDDAAYSLNYLHTYSSSGVKEIKIHVATTSSDSAYYSFDRPATFGAMLVKEIRLGAKFFIYHYNSFQGFQCPISMTKECTTNGTGTSGAFVNCTIPMVVIPRGGFFDCANGFYFFTGGISLPKTATSASSQRLFQYTYVKRLVIPEVSSGLFQPITNSTTLREISIPNSLQFIEQANGQFFQNLSSLHYIDIVQGWVPSQSMVLSGSTKWQTSDMVNFFTKLGTTTNSITLTFGQYNLGKLTEDQKEIATSKGYTLA